MSVVIEFEIICNSCGSLLKGEFSEVDSLYVDECQCCNRSSESRGYSKGLSMANHLIHQIKEKEGK